jgi:formylglycine-generating enzyme required for sulfatase activity
MASFYTFYSFKGGVGRSMALANVADLLARRGLRVLAIDFDLEAPGLERYFQVDKTAALANLGLIDLLQSFKKSLSGAGSLDEQAEFRQLDRFIFPVYPQTLPGGGALHLMTAGQREPAAQYRQYALSVRTFDWQDFYYNWQGEAFFDWLRGELSQAVGSREAYDVVLIDSRTGVTEMGGVCAYQLADVIVMMCAANHQNVEGTRAVVQDFRSASVEALRRGRPLSLVVVPARIEQRDDGLLDAFFTRFDSFFKDEVPPAFAELGLTLRDLTIPYQPEYAFEEVVVSDPERREARRQIGGAFDLLANALTLLARAAPDERLYAKLAEAQAAVQAWLAMAHAAPPYLDVPAPEPFDGADEGIDSDEGGGGGWTAARAPALGTPRMTAPSAAADTAMRFDPTRSFAGYDAFLSYAEGDEGAARELLSALEARGLSVFLDTSALTVGEHIGEAITKALHHSRHLLICVGRLGLSPWQKREIELARGSSQPIKLIPVLLAGAEQDIFSLALRGVADLQSIDLRAWPQETTAFEQLLAELRPQMAPRSESAAPEASSVNPYAGLVSYDEGRVHLLELNQPVLNTLQESLRGSGLAMLVGPSGVGKRSLVSALVAQWRQAGSAEGQVWQVLRLRLSDPDTAARIAAPAQGPQLLVLEDVDRAPGWLYASPPGVGVNVARASPQGTAGAPDPWPIELVARLAEASPQRPVLLVGWDLPVAPWYGLVGPQAMNWGQLRGQAVLMAPPEPEATRRVIESPAVRSGYAFEPGLLDRISKDAGEGAGALLLAQMALTQVWPQAARGFLTNAAYDACKGIVGLYAAHVATQLALLPPDLVPAAQALLLRMVLVHNDDYTMVRPCVWEELMSQPVLAAPQGGQALLWLMNARVITVWRDSPGKLCLSLLRPLRAGNCAALDELVAQHADPLDKLGGLLGNLAVWQSRKEPADALMTGAQLSDALSLLGSWGDHLSEPEKRYIHLSKQAAALTRRRRILAAVTIATLAVVGGGAGLLALNRNKDLAVKQDELQVKSSTLRDVTAALREINKPTATVPAPNGDWQGKGAPVVAASSPTDGALARLFQNIRIYPQYKNAQDKNTVKAMAAALRTYGLKVEPAELVGPDKATCGDIRYYAADDQDRATVLQQATKQVMQTLGYTYAPDLIDLSLRSQSAQKAAGTIEMWMPSLRTLSNAAPTASDNPKDGAALRLVRGDCATLGSAPAQVKALAQKLGQPMTELLKNDLPRQTVWVDGFQMYKFEVTNEQFARYKANCAADPYCPTRWTPRGNAPRAPARYLSWAQADAYCRWAGGGQPPRPEGGKTPRSNDGRIWPWGDQPDPKRYQGKETGGGKAIAEVGHFPLGDSKEGISDLAGNLWELTASPWPDGGHVMKGGSYLNDLMHVRSAWRWASGDEDTGADYLGFRCVIDLPAVK